MESTVSRACEVLVAALVVKLTSIGVLAGTLGSVLKGSGRVLKGSGGGVLERTAVEVT